MSFWRYQKIIFLRGTAQKQKKNPDTSQKIESACTKSAKIQVYILLFDGDMEVISGTI